MASRSTFACIVCDMVHDSKSIRMCRNCKLTIKLPTTSELKTFDGRVRALKFCRTCFDDIHDCRMCGHMRSHARSSAGDWLPELEFCDNVRCRISEVKCPCHRKSMAECLEKTKEKEDEARLVSELWKMNQSAQLLLKQAKFDEIVIKQ